MSEPTLRKHNATEPSTEQVNEPTTAHEEPPLKRTKVEPSDSQAESNTGRSSLGGNNTTTPKSYNNNEGPGMRMSVSAVLAGNTRDLWHRGSPSTGYARLSPHKALSPTPPPPPAVTKDAANTTTTTTTTTTDKKPTPSSSSTDSNNASPKPNSASITSEQLVRALTSSRLSSDTLESSDTSSTPQALGNALAAVAATVNRSSSSSSSSSSSNAAAAIGSLAANISTILHANANDTNPESARRASGILTNPTALTQVLDQAIRLGTQQQKRKSTHEEKQENASKQEENKGFQRIIRNEKAWKALEGYQEKRLGSWLYSPELLLPIDSSQLNGLVEILIPARYLTYNNPKVQKRALWGTDIYTDDSDVVSMIVHCGKYSMKFIEPELDIHDPVSIALSATLDEPIKSKKTTTPYHIPDHDLKVTLRVMPALKHYTGTVQHHIGSRSWGGNHDGLSYWVEHVEKLKRGDAQPRGRHGIKANMNRYACERYRTLGYPNKVKEDQEQEEEEEEQVPVPQFKSAMVRKKKRVVSVSPSPPPTPTSQSVPSSHRRRPFRRAAGRARNRTRV